MPCLWLHRMLLKHLFKNLKFLIWDHHLSHVLYHKLNDFIHRVSPSWVRERSLSRPQLDLTHLEVLLAEVLAVVSNDKFSTNLKLLLDHGEKLISIKLTVALSQSVSGYITNCPLRENIKLWTPPPCSASSQSCGIVLADSPRVLHGHLFWVLVSVIL